MLSFFIRETTTTTIMFHSLLKLILKKRSNSEKGKIVSIAIPRNTWKISIYPNLVSNRRKVNGQVKSYVLSIGFMNIYM
jgi:hypothetical protein